MKNTKRLALLLVGFAFVIVPFVIEYLRARFPSASAAGNSWDIASDGPMSVKDDLLGVAVIVGTLVCLIVLVLYAVDVEKRLRKKRA
jgi:hypothetical protein